MARSLESVLANIPGYAGYLAKRQYNEQEDSNEVRQASGLMQIVQAAQSQQRAQQETGRNEKLRAAIAAMPPEQRTRENVLPLLLEHGNVKELVPLLKTAEKQYQPVGAGGAIDTATGTVIPPAAAPKQEKPIVETGLAKLIRERDALPQGDPRRVIYDNAIRKESETARQISPTVIAPPTERTPVGYRMKPDGTMEAIKGGPADTKIQGQLNQDTASLSGLTANLDRLSTVANEVMNHRGLSGITGVTGAFPDIPGSAAADARAKLESLRAQVGFGVLQDMRNNSKTGGALGQISDRENVLLQNALDALATSQSEEQIKKSLANIIKYSEGAKDRLRSAYNMKHGDRAPSPTTPPAEQPKNDWLERAIKANPNLPRDQVIAEGKRLKKLPEDFR